MSQTQEKIKKNESEWDKKKIIFFSILVIFLLILGLFFTNSILGTNFKKLTTSPAVKGVSTKVDIKENVQKQIQALQEEAESINLSDIATSSPQVQKIIKDLQGIKDYPNNQLKQTCIEMCQKL